jgi:hypothetical protein
MHALVWALVSPKHQHGQQYTPRSKAECDHWHKTLRADERGHLSTYRGGCDAIYSGHAVAYRLLRWAVAMGGRGG